MRCHLFNNVRLRCHLLYIVWFPLQFFVHDYSIFLNKQHLQFANIWYAVNSITIKLTWQTTVKWLESRIVARVHVIACQTFLISRITIIMKLFFSSSYASKILVFAWVVSYMIVLITEYNKRKHRWYQMIL